MTRFVGFFLCILSERDLCCSGATTNDDQVKPRSLRFTWSMKTTSSRDPSEIMGEIRKVSLFETFLKLFETVTWLVEVINFGILWK